MTTLLKTNTFAKRREELRERMTDDSIALIFSAAPAIRSNDVHYRFRQDTDFHYLTGFREEDAVLVMDKDKTRLYLRPKDEETEIWTGRMLGLEAAREKLGIRDTKAIAEFNRDLPLLLRNHSVVYYDYGRDADRDRRVFESASSVLRRARKGNYGPARFIHPSELLHEMRLVKSPEEIENLRECARITGRAHSMLMERVRPGMFEYELEAMLMNEFRRDNAVEAYPSIIAAGENACILHYTENNQEIREGDLVLVDAGAEKDFMSADVTRTFPASGKFSPAQRVIYDLVLRAQEHAVAGTTAGSSMDAVHRATVRYLVQGLLDLDLMHGDIDEIIAKHDKKEEEDKELARKWERKEPPKSEKKAEDKNGDGAETKDGEEKEDDDGIADYKKFYMHGTGHWLGGDVHDVGVYWKNGEPRPLRDGMVCTVEPGIYISPDNETVPEEFRGIGIRIEDDVVVNGNEPINLTGFIPKSIEDIEAMRS